MIFDQATSNLLEKLQNYCSDNLIEYSIRFSKINKGFYLTVTSNRASDYFHTEDEESLFYCLLRFFENLENINKSAGVKNA